MDFFGKEILIAGIVKAVEVIIEKFSKTNLIKTLTSKQKQKICNAIISIKNSSDETQQFISVTGYERNTDLKKMWQKSLKLVVKANINEGLEGYLYHKADFWGNPQQWLAEPSSMKLVPKLKELDKKCDILLEMIKHK